MKRWFGKCRQMIEAHYEMTLAITKGMCRLPDLLERLGSIDQSINKLQTREPVRLMLPERNWALIKLELQKPNGTSRFIAVHGHVSVRREGASIPANPTMKHTFTEAGKCRILDTDLPPGTFIHTITVGRVVHDERFDFEVDVDTGTELHIYVSRI